jgi:hypothetical protein
MPTARTQEAEWRQVLQESVSMGAREDESSTRRVRVAGFHHLTARSLGGRFETYKPLFI